MFGAGFADKLGRVGDILAGNSAYGSQQQQALENQLRQQQTQAEASRASRPIVQATGDGGYVVIDPNSGQIIHQERGTPHQTALQQNYEYLKSVDPAKAETYLNAQSNPQTLMTDPTTGAVGFFPKGGIAPSAPSNRPAIGTVVPNLMGGAGQAAPRTFP